jgi:ribonuclease T1
MKTRTSWRRQWRILVALMLLIILAGCQPTVNRPAAETSNTSVAVAPEEHVLSPTDNEQSSSPAEGKAQVEWGQRYSGQTEVAAYIHSYHVLPPNYLTKKAAQKLGWDSNKGNLWQVTDHMSIGGDRFGNEEGLLPSIQGRQYYECDVNYAGGYRGAERIIYSSDGLIFYTRDHYQSFRQLY